ADPLAAAVPHQRQRRQRLRRRTPDRHELRVARSRDEPAGRIHRGDVDLVNGLDPPPAELLNAHDRSRPCSLLPEIGRSPAARELLRAPLSAVPPTEWKEPTRQS